MDITFLSEYLEPLSPSVRPLAESSMVLNGLARLYANKYDMTLDFKQRENTHVPYAYDIIVYKHVYVLGVSIRKQRVEIFDVMRGGASDPFTAMGECARLWLMFQFQKWFPAYRLSRYDSWTLENWEHAIRNLPSKLYEPDSAEPQPYPRPRE